MTEHAWETTLVVDAVLGFTQPPHPYKIYAPDSTAVAITGMVCALSMEHGMGHKVKLGPLWMRRARERAEFVENQLEDL